MYELSHAVTTPINTAYFVLQYVLTEAHNNKFEVYVLCMRSFTFECRGGSLLAIYRPYVRNVVMSNVL